jgi:hypothetical protein
LSLELSIRCLLPPFLAVHPFPPPFPIVKGASACHIWKRSSYELRHRLELVRYSVRFTVGRHIGTPGCGATRSSGSFSFFLSSESCEVRSLLPMADNSLSRCKLMSRYNKLQPSK